MQSAGKTKKSKTKKGVDSEELTSGNDVIGPVASDPIKSSFKPTAKMQVLTLQNALQNVQ